MTTPRKGLLTAKEKAAAVVWAEARGALAAPEEAALQVLGNGFDPLPSEKLALLAHVRALAPKTSIEGYLAGLSYMLSVQSAATLRLGTKQSTYEGQRVLVGLGERLAGRAIQALEALARSRRPAEQRIVIERVEPGGRVAVAMGVGAGDGRRDEHQPLALAHAPGAAMPRVLEEDRAAVPVAGGEG